MNAEARPYGRMKNRDVGWQGGLPVHWIVRRLKTVARILNGATPSSSTPAYWNGDISWVTPEDLGRLSSRYIRHTARRITEEGFRSCGTSLAPAGSLAISTRAPIGHIGILTSQACSNQGCRLLVPNVSVDSTYLYHLLEAAKSELVSRGRGTTFAELSRGALGNFVLPVPPLSSQLDAVHFLDASDRLIRRYIRSKQTMIALLEEQKQAIINQAVTGQINLRTGHRYAAYKASGVEWLGEIPAHWDVRRSKRVFKPRGELARPNDIQLSATQAYGVIAQKDYEAKVGRKIVRILRHLEQRRHVEIDDFVISMRSFQGGLERAWATGCIRSSYIVLRPATNLSVGYFGHLFKSSCYVTALQSTANFIRDGQDLNFENFCRVGVPLPPLAEQQCIAQMLDRVALGIASAIERSNRQVNLLREWRRRLIADVVTGKLELRKTVVEQPEVDPPGANDGGDGPFDDPDLAEFAAEGNLPWVAD